MSAAWKGETCHPVPPPSTLGPGGGMENCEDEDTEEMVQPQNISRVSGNPANYSPPAFTGCRSKWQTHSSTLAWRIPWTEQAGGLQSMGSQRVWHSWATNTNFYRREKWNTILCQTLLFWAHGVSSWSYVLILSVNGHVLHARLQMSCEPLGT